jgi:hypothetical protein
MTSKNLAMASTLVLTPACALCRLFQTTGRLIKQNKQSQKETPPATTTSTTSLVTPESVPNTTTMSQPEGFVPRLNAEMVKNDARFHGMIVSVVGRVKSRNMADGQIEFECSDGGILDMDLTQAELPDQLDDTAFEAIGQVDNGNFLVCVACHWVWK